MTLDSPRAPSVWEGDGLSSSAGEGAILDVNATRVGASRALGDVRAAEAKQAERLGQLRALLGLDPQAVVVLSDSPGGRSRAKD
jgi:outer membrane protein TolC